MNPPCGWPLLYCTPAAVEEGQDQPETGCTHLEALDADLRAAVVSMATAHLWRWTGQVYGLCEVTVRPSRVCPPGSTYRGVPRSGWTPVLIAGQWRNIGCGSCLSLCGCDHVPTVVLPHPVHQVHEVQIDGVILDPTAYRVDARRRLVRQDGGEWPAVQDLSRPAGDEGTWTVRFDWGAPVPPEGQLAAGLLACELAKAVCSADECRLPQRVQTVTREGVTVGILDPFDGLDQGATGLWTVDAWVASVTRSPARSRVYSPDRRDAVVVTPTPAPAP